MTLYQSEVTSTRFSDLVEEFIKYQMHKALTLFSLKIYLSSVSIHSGGCVFKGYWCMCWKFAVQDQFEVKDYSRATLNPLCWLFEQLPLE